MKKNLISKFILCFSFIAFLLILSSCNRGGGNVSSPSISSAETAEIPSGTSGVKTSTRKTEDGNYARELDPEDEPHYLVFYFPSSDGSSGNTEVARILVVEGDTYESLLPFFPVLPPEVVIDGYTFEYKWPKLNEVYSSTEKEITITATFKRVE